MNIPSTNGQGARDLVVSQFIVLVWYLRQAFGVMYVVKFVSQKLQPKYRHSEKTP